MAQIVGKPAGRMYPGTMHVPLLRRVPEGRGAGPECGRLASTVDIPATVAAAAELEGLPLDETSLGAAAEGGCPGYNIGYIRFRESTEGVETIPVSESMNVDVSPDGTVYGIELLDANRQLAEEGHLTFVNEGAGTRQVVTTG